MCKFVKKTTKKAGKLMIAPFKWYVKAMTKGYEEMYGDNLQYIKFWM
jgi:hypothetical protein